MTPELKLALERLRTVVKSGRDTVFIGKEPFGVREVLSDGEVTAHPDVLRIASDGCGNDYELNVTTGRVTFRDHETNEILQTASSLNELIASLVHWEGPKLEPNAVKSVWIDPAFAEELEKQGILKKK